MAGSRASVTGWWLLAVGIVASMVMSAHGLSLIEWPYAADWGPMVAGIDLGNWLVFIGFVFLLQSYGQPASVATRQLAAQPALAVYAAASLFTLVYCIGRYGTAVAGSIIDALLIPAICALSVLTLDRQRRYALLKIVLAALLINAASGLATRYFPARLNMLPLGGYPEMILAVVQPKAYFGHPMNNALLTASLLPVVLYLRINMAWRGAFILLLWAALLSTGETTTLVIATLVYGSWLLGRATKAALRGRFGYAELTGIAALVGAAATVIALAITQGGGERVTLAMRLDSTSRFWLGMATQLGAAGSAAVAVGLAAAVWWLCRRSSAAIRLSVVQFFATAACSNSLASVTVTMAMLFLVAALTRRMFIPRASSSRPADNLFLNSSFAGGVAAFGDRSGMSSFGRHDEPRRTMPSRSWR